MIVALLGMAILAGLMAAGAMLVMGQGMMLALAAYMGGGAVALLLGGVAVALRQAASGFMAGPVRPS